VPVFAEAREAVKAARFGPRIKCPRPASRI
jgi:hypothetical protein